jgi:hypothetical protein
MKAIELFRRNLKRCNDILDVHRRIYKTRPAKEDVIASDLLRAILVFEVAALDGYVHKRIVEVVGSIVEKKKSFPKNSLERLVSTMKEECRCSELINIGMNNNNPKKAYLKLFEMGISRQTYQGVCEIDSALRMMDVEEFWNKIKCEMTAKRGPKLKGRKEDVKIFLKELVDRRNKIVHEGDLISGKKMHGKFRSITRKYIARSLDKINKFVEGFDIVSNK